MDFVPKLLISPFGESSSRRVIPSWSWRHPLPLSYPPTNSTPSSPCFLRKIDKLTLVSHSKRFAHIHVPVVLLFTPTRHNEISLEQIPWRKSGKNIFYFSPHINPCDLWPQIPRLWVDTQGSSSSCPAHSSRLTSCPFTSCSCSEALRFLRQILIPQTPVNFHRTRSSPSPLPPLLSRSAQALEAF